MAKLSMYTPIKAWTGSSLDVARDYIMHGVPVFPCREVEVEDFDPNTGEFVTFKEKTPLTSNGLNGATRTPRLVDIHFGDRHPTALIGVPTGEKLGGWVLDIDRHGDRDGHEWLAEMEAKHGPLPATARATTANGGTHIFFRHVEGVRNRAAIADGVDTRGDGGYIIGPGSVMADGRSYAWIDHDSPDMPEFADAPQWLLDMVISRAPAPDQPSRTEYRYTPGDNSVYVERAVEAELHRVATTTTGERGSQLFASACALGEFVAAGALSRSEAEAGLYQAAAACGVLAKDGDRETRNKIKRGLDKTQSSPRDIPAPQDVAPGLDLERLVQNSLRKREAAMVPAPANDDAPAAPPPKKERERFQVTWFDQIEEGKPKETIIKGVFGVEEFTTVSGLPGTGKSVIVTDAACHVAAGMEWHGRRVKRGLVIYVAAERKKLTERRMMAFRKKYDVHDVPLLVVAGRLDFTSSLKDVRELIALIKGAEEQTGLKCVWVIIDTLTRVFGPGDQNASKDMTRFVQACDEILVEIQAHVTAIHHSAWTGERGKGAIDLDGAVDSSFMVKKDHGRYKLVCDGANDGEEGDIVCFTMEGVQIGVDEDGEPTMAPVVVADAPNDGGKPMTSGSLKGYKGDVLHALHTAIELGGIEPDGAHFPDDVLVVDEVSWRNAFYATRDMDAASIAATTKKQFQRAPKDLVDAGHVVCMGQWYWPA